MKQIITCIVCNQPLQGRQSKFCSTKCKNKLHQGYNAQKDRGVKRKLELIKLAGGKCSKCGYCKNSAALSFHHIDAKEKEFKLDMRSISNRDKRSIMAELDKCVLLCSNCHAEEHNPHLDLVPTPLSRLL
ncbi:hypothetical protein COT83_01235 [Candidatus Peregrinibacteria bacterium CG10_big_fil_rev_8_21_14_0_10_44_7]|nr:MAG: hypothetical protein COT83_01235 [Candidatus Peregrinibacteria bacterium CG10_big_fil_rev_8_21_14_0_10_44_7]PJB88293.1 MAG: hypothetical protein CO082_04930 [Candidatus Peregrinibacteria bacterium CG_4_9_14_0_8_um_filter_44_15]